MAPAHRFIDSLGNVVEGRDSAQQAWRMYLQLVPDYRITIQRSFTIGDEVMLAGVAEGSLARDGRVNPQDRWTTPAAFRVATERGLIREWQVFADNEPIRRLMRQD